MLALVAGMAPAAFGFHGEGPEPLPDQDARVPSGGRVTSAAASPGFTRLADQVPGVHVELDEFLGTPAYVRNPNGFLTGPQVTAASPSAKAPSALPPADPDAPLKAFLDEHRALFGVGGEALAAARQTRAYVTPHNGVRSVVWQQQVDGIPVFEAVLMAHTTGRGELVNVASRFVADPPAAANTGTSDRAALVAAPPVTAARALAAALANLGESTAADEVSVRVSAQGAEQVQALVAPGITGAADARLVWLPMSATELRLCWRLVLTVRARGEMYLTLVDAQSGAVLVRRCLTNYYSDATYRVFVSDSPSPRSPGWPTPMTNQPPLTNRVLVTLSALSSNASPNGWINDGDNTTVGNNVDAHTDRNDDDVPDPGSQPAGAPFRTFDFGMDLTQAPSTYTNASVVQLFYWNNWMHDRLYALGFTEAAGNFQTDNFNRGGLGNDAVQADAQDGGGTDNANFATPPDGIAPRMQMYTFTGPTPDRDGSLDAEVVLHEYAHGLSNRRVGGGVGISALQSRGMGEGWSDFYGLALLSEPGDDTNGNHAAGGYLSYRLANLTQNYYYGIRRYPYTIDLSRNPLTFKDIDPAQASSHPGVPRSPLAGGSADSVHNMGEVWCVTLWDARANLIARHGAEAGNELILQLVTDAMALGPANPNFLQARDAILQADLVNSGGANRMALWQAFAKRGMGFSATSPSSSTTVGLVEAFDVPDELVLTPPADLVASGYVGGPFAPSATVYRVSNVGTTALPWSVSASAPWVSLGTAGGTLGPGVTNNVVVTLNAAAGGLTQGVYTAALQVSNAVSQVVQSRAVRLSVLEVPGEILVLDSIPPPTDTNMPFGTVIIGSVRREQITVTNLDAGHWLEFAYIGLGGNMLDDFEDGEMAEYTWAPNSDYTVVAAAAHDGALGLTGSSGTWIYRADEDVQIGPGAKLAWWIKPQSSGRIYCGFGASSAGTYSIVAAVNSSEFLIQRNPNYTYTELAATPFAWELDQWYRVEAEWQAGGGLVGRLYDSDGTTPLATVSAVDTTITGGGLALRGFSEHNVDSIELMEQGAAAAGGDPVAGFQPVRASADSGPLVWDDANRAFVAAAASLPVASAGEVVPLAAPAFQLEQAPTSFPYRLAPGGSFTLTVLYAPTAVGTNMSLVVFRSNDADEPEVAVSMSGIAVLDKLVAQPSTGFASEGHPGGPFTPPSTLYTLSNTGTNSVTWAASIAAGWAAVTPAGGTLGPGASAPVTVQLTAAANALAVGTHSNRVVFSNVTSTAASSRPVTLTVYTSPIITVAPPRFDVTNILGGSTLRTLTLGNDAAADGHLDAQLSDQETGRGPVGAFAFVPELPAPERDFTRVQPGVDFVPGRLLVRFQTSVDQAARSALLARMSGATVRREYSLVRGLCLVELGPDQTVEGALKVWNGMPEVVYAEPDYRVHTLGMPNDARFSELWGMHNTGQSGGTPDADIDAPEAWDIQTGSRDVIVGVIDTGVDYTHPDLQANMWQNPAETPGNGVDDDGNGYVDDVYGINAITSSGDPQDDHYHGTHCAGTVGGVGNNGVGVAGVCWQVRIMALKFLSSSGSGSSADAITCIEYGVDKGARVLSNSWGGGGFLQSLKDAIDAAGAAGIVFVAAAGNSGLNTDTTPHYPSTYDSSNMVAVMATDDDDLTASFSNYGRETVDLAAPGVSVLSCEPGNAYQTLSGTSMATPHVAGACALLLSQNSSLTVRQMQEALLRSVDVPADPPLCVSSGRLNVARALLIAGSDWISVTPPAVTNVAPGTSTNLTVKFAAGDLGAGSYTGVIVVASNDRITPSTNVPVRMVVLPDAIRLAPADGLAAAGTRGGPFAPDSKTYVVSNAGPSVLNWAVGWTRTWLDVAPSGGTLGAGGTATVTVTLNLLANQLAAGTHTDQLVFSNLASGAAYRRAVVLAIAPAGVGDDLIVSPTTGFESKGALGGPFAPSNAVYRLVNAGPGSLPWTAGSTQAWLSIQPPAGILAPGTSTNVTASINGLALALPVGTHLDAIVFSNAASHVAQARAASLRVKAPPPVPFNPVPTHGAVGVAVPTTLTWNNTGSAWRARAPRAVPGPGASSLVPVFDVPRPPTPPAAPGVLTDVAIFQDFTPWGLSTMEDILTANGITFASFSSADMGNVDLAPYQKVIIASTQWEVFYDQLATNRAWFEAYVETGGILDLHLASYSFASVDGVVLPGGFVVSRDEEDDVTIVAPDHPIMNQPHPIGDADLDNWFSSTHGFFSTIPGDATALVTARGRPCAMEMPLGAGRIFATVQAMGWYFASDAYLENTLLYDANGSGERYHVLLGTTQPPTNVVGSGLYEPLCQPGQLAYGATYYWRVIASNDVATTTGPVWSFATLPPPRIVLNPTNMVGTLVASNSTASRVLSVSNAGPSELVWALLPPGGVFGDNVESGANGWTHSGTLDMWHIATNRSASPTRAWYCGQDATRTYSNSMNCSLVSGPIVPGPDATLTFRHWYKTELGYDYGYVEISTNNGTSYTTLATFGGDGGGWQTVSNSLAAYAGRTARIRFRFFTDSSIVDEGWYVDDIVVSSLSQGGAGTNNWLLVNTQGGSLPASSGTNVVVTFDALGLTNGQSRTSQLIFTSNDPLAPTSAVPVGMLVAEGLMIALPAQVREGDGLLAGAGEIRLLAAQPSDLTITLSSSDASEIVVTNSVTIPAGQTNVSVDLAIQDDSGADGPQVATVTALASGYPNAVRPITVHDNEAVALAVTVPATATEGAGVLANAGRVTVNTPAAANVLVQIASGDITEIMPTNVIVMAGQTSAVFHVTVMDDTLIDGPQTAFVTAEVPYWSTGTGAVTVLDNESMVVSLALPASAWEGTNLPAGSGRAIIPGSYGSNLVVSLTSLDTTELTVPASVTIVAGQTSAVFNATVVNDTELDGTQTVTVVATAPGFTGGSAQMLIRDNDPHHFTLGAISSPRTVGVPFPVSLSVRDVNDTLISVHTNAAWLAVAGDGGPALMAPTNTGRFTAGQWTSNIVVLTPGTGMRLTAHDGLGHSGTSGVFRVDMGPQLAFIPQAMTGVQVTVGATLDQTLTVSNAGQATLTWTLSAPGSALTNNAEQGEGTWTHSGTNDLWHISTNRCASPTRAWYCGNESTRVYSNSMNCALVSPPLTLGVGARLTFQHWYQTQSGSDRGFVDISTNNGTAYTTLSTFEGTGNSWRGWTNDLAAYSGSTVRIRFRFSSSASTVFEGWYLDDLAVSPLQDGLTGTWARISATNGSLAAGAATNLTVRFVASGMTNGEPRSGHVIARSNDPLLPVRALPVSMVAVPSDAAPIGASPTNVSVSSAAGQNPSNALVGVWGTAGRPLPYVLVPNVPWISVSPSNGTATLATNTHMLVFGAAGLPAGVVTGVVAVVASGYTNAPRVVVLLTLLGAADQDGDGLPDAWESRYGLSVVVSNAPTANADSDWMSDWQEYVADTDPTNRMSVFPAITNVPGATVWILQIQPTSTGRLYDVYWKSNLVSDHGHWNPCGFSHAGTGGQLLFVVTNTAPFGVYRTGVRLP